MQEHSPPRWGSNSPLLLEEPVMDGLGPILPSPAISACWAVLGKHAHTDTCMLCFIHTHTCTYKCTHLTHILIYTCLYTTYIYKVYIYIHTCNKFSYLILMVPWAFPYNVSEKAGCHVRLRLQSNHAKATANAVETLMDLQLCISITQGQ